MPTGYTAGIIDGTTATFQDYAKQCMRAFGACIHMRDDDSDKEYEPRIPSDYYTKELIKARENLEKAITITDNQLVDMRVKELNSDKEYHLKRISEIKNTRIRLDDFLAKAIEFNPPTSGHGGIRTFMIEQLQTTIKYDGETNYHDEELLEIELELKDINPSKIRQNLIADANRDIEYNTMQYDEELKRCTESNQWVKLFLSSLK